MWMLSGHLCRYVYQALEDSNSYTRASALTCLQKLLNSCELTAGLLQQCHITMDDVYRKVLRILQEDTEAFPRRECVSFITKTWHCVHSGFKDQIYEILAEGTSNDFDWEVKMKLVEFWEMLINQELLMTDVKLPSYAVQSSEKEQAIGTIQNIQELVKTKCFDCLLRLLDDYDQSVCEKACLLMIRLKDYLADVLQDSLTSNSLAKKRKTDDSPTDMESIYEKLKALDLTCRLLQVSRTCDEYDKNPMSLLEDMLSYQTDRPHDLTSPHHDTNAVDCY
ncbi:BRCA1-associated ATM activator 1-like [Argopecten irradians]|uniref:BRCA1-associated ATM activator 1-like n=1 Tax=Argopecten irradians TaxID=31199 RepID=UPI0037158B95